jgi:hypothetical protein
MAVTPALQTQIAALQARIDAVAPNASPEDVVMLAKAIEAISGQASVFDVIAYGDTQKSALALALTEALATLESKLAAASSQLGETAQVQLAQVVAQAQALRAEFDAALETFAAFEGATSATPGSLGMVPAPPASLSRQFLRNDGQWADTPNLPVGAFAFVQPQLLGTGWPMAAWPRSWIFRSWQRPKSKSATPCSLSTAPARWWFPATTPTPRSITFTTTRTWVIS